MSKAQTEFRIRLTAEEITRLEAKAAAHQIPLEALLSAFVRWGHEALNLSDVDNSGPGPNALEDHIAAEQSANAA